MPAKPNPQSTRSSSKEMAHQEPITLEQDLLNWSQEKLLTLFSLRPDLAVPPPSSSAILANRITLRASVLRASEQLNLLALALIEALALAGADYRAVPTNTVVTAINNRASSDSINNELLRLNSLGLIWGTHKLRIIPTAAEVLPWRIGRLIAAEPPRPSATIEAELASLSQAELTLLRTLAQSSTLGRTRDAAPGTPSDRPVQRLLNSGFLSWVDSQTVELPLWVRQALRIDNSLELQELSEPIIKPITHDIKDIDDSAAGEILELLRQCTAVITELGHTPALALRTSGLGIRELRRLSKNSGVTDEIKLGLLVELLAASGLIAFGSPDPPPVIDSTDDYWAPSLLCDSWLEATLSSRWLLLATAWLDLARRPALIGQRLDGRPIAALSEELKAPYAPQERNALLALLASLNLGSSSTSEELRNLLIWQHPRWESQITSARVDQLLAEATALGVISMGALSTPGRALVIEQAPEHVLTVLESSLPTPLDYFLTQADLTVIAPGPLVPEVQSEISSVADIESSGTATVYRVTEESIRRALDAGRTAAELHSLFHTRSRTPVPQSLTYLIDDVSRRHGQLRVGVASSFIRCEDPALLTEALTSKASAALGLRLLAPTVAISQSPISEVLTQLRSAGFAPAGEDRDGLIVNLAARGARIPVRPKKAHRKSAKPLPEQLENAINIMRAGDASLPADSNPVSQHNNTPSTTTTILQVAARTSRSVSIHYVDSSDNVALCTVNPISIEAGQLHAFDLKTKSNRQFILYRISSVTFIEE
ncbi:MAG: helicase-associated domain-containing protein [Mycobacteriaceae bacterium]